MQDDERCCGTGTCLINAQGLCWCGQQWDGAAMRFLPITGKNPDPCEGSTSAAQASAGDQPTT